MQYVFPAIFKKEREDKITVRFPDIDGCITSGSTLAEAFEMARDALGLMLSFMEDNKNEIPVANLNKALSLTISHIDNENPEFVLFVSCDTERVVHADGSTSVIRTINIPKHVDDLMQERNINLNVFVENALREALKI